MILRERAHALRTGGHLTRCLARAPAASPPPPPVCRLFTLPCFDLLRCTVRFAIAHSAYVLENRVFAACTASACALLTPSLIHLGSSAYVFDQSGRHGRI